MAQSGDAATAAERLEAAVDRLADAIPAAIARARQGAAPAEGVPAAEVAALAERLDATLVRLRAALAERDAEEG